MTQRTCTFPGCDRRHDCRGLCKAHHSQLRRGVSLRAIGETLGVEERFIMRTAWDGSCLVWMGRKSRSGYGRMSIGSKNVAAHRYSWEIANGPIPAGMVIDHICHNPACVLPEHLRIATTAENARNRKGTNMNNRSSGYRNVQWVPAKGKYRVRIRFEGKPYGGSHATLESAIAEAEQLRAKFFGEYQGSA